MIAGLDRLARQGRSATSTRRCCARPSTAPSATSRSRSATSCAPGKRLLAVVPLAGGLRRGELQGDPDRRARAAAPRSTCTSTPSPTATLIGTVEGIAPASGSQFSLLPPENATGNFTKVVQRAPGADRGAGRCGRRGLAPAGPLGRGRGRRPHRRAARRGRGALKRRRRHGQAAEAAEPKITPRRLIAFFALVFGMFMAILDIQIVSSSLGEIQAGLVGGAGGDRPGCRPAT